MRNLLCQNIMFLLIAALLVLSLFYIPVALAEEDAVTFQIDMYQIEGNTLFPEVELQKVVEVHAGPGKTADDVESARDALEKHYHTKGYPTVVVIIPEQSVEEGVVVLEVIESRIRRVRVTGNRWFTMEKILKDLPSITTGRVLYVPDVQKELAVINQNKDLKVAPVLVPGREIGTIDVELKVKDKMPLHGSLELNNRSTHQTTDLRLNGMISYDNLWQKEHSVTLQFQTSPQETSEVQAITSSYVMPALWNSDQFFVMYGLWSDSETAFGEGFETIGSGFIVGIRNIIPLPQFKRGSQTISIGLDYKDFKEDLGFEEDEETIKTPITYAPLTAAYNAVLGDDTGYTKLNLGVNFLFRNLAGDPMEFGNKRYKSLGNYIYSTVGLERNQDLPMGFNVSAKVDGQFSNQPLISNEQYVAGGMQSVRGYKESEAAGDNAVRTSIELGRLFQFLEKEGNGSSASLTPYVFFDSAWLYIKDALEGQTENYTLQGAGGGIRGSFFNAMDFQIDAATALSDTEDVKSGDFEFYFKVKAYF